MYLFLLLYSYLDAGHNLKKFLSAIFKSDRGLPVHSHLDQDVTAACTDVPEPALH